MTPNCKISDRIIEQIHEVASYVGDCDDWVTVKKEIMRGIPSTLRSKFSRRHPITKEQQPNDFDREVINYYREVTGVELRVRTLDERREIFDVL